MAHKSKQEITAIIASVLLAFVMWIYAMTDKNPMDTKRVDNIPVQLINTEALEQFDLAVTPEQNFVISLDIRGRALDVYAAADPGNFNIVADLNSVAFLKKGENNIPVQIQGDLPKGIQVENTNGIPYQIKVKLESLDTKSVPVNVNLIGSVKEGYGYLDPITKPSELVVRGPESVVNLVNRIEGEIDITNKSNDANGSIAVKAVDKDGQEVKHVTVASPVVDVSVPIRPSKEVDVVVKTIGSVGGNKVLKKINQSTSRVIIVGDRKNLDKVKEIETVPYDISHITSTYTDTLSLQLPEGIDIFHGMGTINVEFVVENIIDSTIKIPINTINPRDGYSYSTSVSEISVTLRGPESLINSFDSSSIAAIVNVNNLDAGQHNLEYKINVPNGISISRTSPEKITVTITKPEQQTSNP